MGVGLESGLLRMANTMFDVCVCAIYYDGQTHIGISPAFPLPPAAAQAVLAGKDETQALIEAGVEQKVEGFDNGTGLGALGVLTQVAAPPHRH